MSANVRSVHSTVESDAWSRDFDYEDYVRLHDEYGRPGAVLCREAYSMFCEAMEIQYAFDNRGQ